MNNSISARAGVFVLVVEPAASIRMVLMDVLRSLGFNSVQGVPTCKDALKMLEVEPINWLIMPLMASEPVNALQIIKLVTTEPNLRSVITSLLIDPSTEEYCLASAFELGLFSWHRKSYVKENLQQDFEALMAQLALHGDNMTLTSAEYLRRFLTERRMYKSRIALEENLMTLYPGSAKVLINMAEAEIFIGGEARAAGLLNQAEIVDKRIKPYCDQLREKYLKNLPAGTQIASENVLGVRKVLLIDPDTDVLFAFKEMLGQLGVKSIEAFEDGKRAADWLAAEAQEPDLIIMEWRLPGLSGPVLAQRIRQSEFFQVPIIVASSLVKKEEKPLLREMGVDEVLEKPFDQAAFNQVVIWALQQNKAPTEQKSLERKIRRLLNAGKQGEAERLIAQYLSDDRVREGSKKEIKAEHAFATGDDRAVCELGIEALRLGGDTLALLNLVGKALLRLQQYARALQCFEKANAICSINVERLLSVAEVNLHLDRPSDASKALDAAATIDRSNPALGELKCKLDLEAGDLDAAVKGIDGLESVPRVAAYINNRAIALARSGRFEDGIALYQRAIQCLSGKWNDLGASVSYNLGLAYARYGEYDDALKTLQTICTDPAVPVFKKALSLMRKIKASLKDGTVLFSDQGAGTGLGEENFAHVVSGKSKTQDTRQNLEELMTKITASRGDLCCYLIFHSLEEMDPKAQVLFEKMPRFALRKAVEKIQGPAGPA